MMDARLERGLQNILETCLEVDRIAGLAYDSIALPFWDRPGGYQVSLGRAEAITFAATPVVHPSKIVGRCCRWVKTRRTRIEHM